jgi:hypothetical protein
MRNEDGGDRGLQQALRLRHPLVAQKRAKNAAGLLKVNEK